MKLIIYLATILILSCNQKINENSISVSPLKVYAKILYKDKEIFIIDSSVIKTMYNLVLYSIQGERNCNLERTKIIVYLYYNPKRPFVIEMDKFNNVRINGICTIQIEALTTLINKLQNYE